MRNVKQRIAKVAQGMAPVLVRGESGTGKELVAQALHACSQRAEGPCIAVNCGAIPRTCSKPNSSGARKGSYTGATQDRDGYFQAARGAPFSWMRSGTCPGHAIETAAGHPGTQRASAGLHPGRNGGRADCECHHRDLAADVQAGRFRQDLYYRLNVIEIVIPPLRERRGRPARFVRHAAGAHWSGLGHACAPAHRTSLAGDCHPSAHGQRARTGERAAPRSGID